MIWCVSTYAHTHPHHRPAVISSLAIPPVYSVIEFPLWATFTRLYRYLSCCLHWCSLLLFLSNRSVALEHLPLSCRLVFPAFFSLSVDLYGELLRTRTLNQRCNVVYCIKWMGDFPPSFTNIGSTEKSSVDHYIHHCILKQWSLSNTQEFFRSMHQF